MTIADTKTVESYVSQVMEVRGVLANISEFADSLPAPDENENINGMHYGHIGSIGRIHTLLTEASEMCDELCEDW